MQPLVSVICLCYNHEPFVEEALLSVLNQTYSNIEIIVVDDASSDGSKSILEVIARQHNLPFINLQANIGNCAAFNKGWALARGKYIIDFATDDAMLPNRIEKQVSFFESLPDEFGVIYSNARYVNAQGNLLHNHFGTENALMEFHSRFEGDVYAAVLKTFFIPPPTMMIKNVVLKALNGYDESLAYEDFDFWVRSSRTYKYGYQDETLTKIRKSSASLSTRLYKIGDQQLMSTYKVCLKAARLNRNRQEKEALTCRLRYEARHAVLTGNYKEASLFFTLLKQNKGFNLTAQFFQWMGMLRLPLQKWRRFYLQFRYGKAFATDN